MAGSMRLLLICSVLALAATSLQAAPLDRFQTSRRFLLTAPPPAGEEPPEGTLVSLWEAVTAKSDGGQFWGTPISPYAWASTFPAYAGRAFLVYRLKSAYVAGPGGAKTDLQLSTTCDTASLAYPTTQQLYDSCKGTATFPSDVSLTGFWAILENDGQVVHVAKPFDHVEVSAALFSTIQATSATFLAQGDKSRELSHDVSPFWHDFDFGPAGPLSSPNVQSVGVIGSAYVPSSVGTSAELAFERLTLKVTYTGAHAKKGDTLAWGVPYTAASFFGANNTPPHVTTTPAGYTVVPASTPCPSVNGVPTNSCFNTVGSHHVCCINPDSCGAFTVAGDATCTNDNNYYFHN